MLALLFLLAFVGAATAKPRITVANDGFPTGQDTPEGAAVDLARAFIRQDAAQFRQTCTRPYGAGSVRADYVEYLDGVAAHFRKDPRDQSSENPRRILRVFAARHLSADGPASYGYAIFNFQEVKDTGKRGSRQKMVRPSCARCFAVAKLRPVSRKPFDASIRRFRHLDTLTVGSWPYHAGHCFGSASASTKNTPLVQPKPITFM